MCDYLLQNEDELWNPCESDHENDDKCGLELHKKAALTTSKVKSHSSLRDCMACGATRYDFFGHNLLFVLNFIHYLLSIEQEVL